MDEKEKDECVKWRRNKKCNRIKLLFRESDVVALIKLIREEEEGGGSNGEFA